jgi:hypothetical protein
MELIDKESNTWSSSITEFTLQTANHFYSYGAPSIMEGHKAGTLGMPATVHFDVNDVLDNMIDGGRSLDFSDLSPSSFGVVEDFIEGNHNLEPGTYTLDEIKMLTNADGRSFEHYTYIDGNLYDLSSVFQSPTGFSASYAIGLYKVSIDPNTKFVVTENGEFIIEDFAYTVDLGDYDFDSALVDDAINRTYEFIVDLANPVGWLDTKVILIVNGVRYVGTVTIDNYGKGYLSLDPHCFVSGTSILMWHKAASVHLGGKMGAPSSTDTIAKPIEDIRPGDLVLSYDKSGNLAPGRVVRTFSNTATHIIDFWGVGVTPGHAYYCAEGKFKGQHVPLMDVLRTDGAVVRDDGTLIRATTGCEVGSDDDQMLHAITAYPQSNGQLTIAEVGQIRLGTRVLFGDGKDFSVRELIEESGGLVTDDGYIKTGTDYQKKPFRWTFSKQLPKPEDYILQRSNVSLEEIYAAGEWEAITTRLDGPNATGSHIGRSSAPRAKPAPNIPSAFADHPDAPAALQCSVKTILI